MSEAPYDPEMLVCIDEALAMGILDANNSIIRNRMMRDRAAGKKVPLPKARERSRNVQLYRAGDLAQWATTWGPYVPRGALRKPRWRPEAKASPAPQPVRRRSVSVEIVEFLMCLSDFGVHLTRLDAETNTPRTVRNDELMSMLMRWQGVTPVREEAVDVYGGEQGDGLSVLLSKIRAKDE